MFCRQLTQFFHGFVLSWIHTSFEYILEENIQILGGVVFHARIKIFWIRIWVLCYDIYLIKGITLQETLVSNSLVPLGFTVGCHLIGVFNLFVYMYVQTNHYIIVTSINGFTTWYCLFKSKATRKSNANFVLYSKLINWMNKVYARTNYF